MTDQPAGQCGQVAVLGLPASIDLSNAWQVGQDIRACYADGVRTLIADLRATRRCSVGGVHYLELAWQQAAGRHEDLRLVIPPGSEALRVFALTGHDRWLPVYPSVAAALAGTHRELHMPTSTSAGSLALSPRAAAGEGGNPSRPPTCSPRH